MTFDQNLSCIDKDGNENNFKYSLSESEENDCKKWIFKVIPEQDMPGDFLNFQ